MITQEVTSPDSWFQDIARKLKKEEKIDIHVFILNTKMKSTFTEDYKELYVH